MITLKTLLDQLQDICRCMVRNDYDTTRFISRIDILRQNTVLCPDTLYLWPDDIPENLLKPNAFSTSDPELSPALLIDAALSGDLRKVICRRVFTNNRRFFAYSE